MFFFQLLDVLTNKLCFFSTFGRLSLLGFWTFLSRLYIFLILAL